MPSYEHLIKNRNQNISQTKTKMGPLHLAFNTMTKYMSQVDILEIYLKFDLVKSLPPRLKPNSCLYYSSTRAMPASSTVLDIRISKPQ
ncbi:hypothetical protein VNO77_18157 [Canavalia gladiata]|uniref:Uncharacterized protein n=1 Tax=Canavalia gladiata TaxID=3824 RepID=A0AAN9LKA8_CANGL